MNQVARAHAISLGGLQGTVVCVEAHVGPGLVMTRIVGNGDSSLREASDRVRAAFLNCDIPFLDQRLTVNLSPADLPKTGASFDLAIAVAILVAREILDQSIAWKTAFVAELALDGSLRPVRGTLALAWAARENGFTHLVVARESAGEAALVKGLSVQGCGHLNEILRAFPAGAPAGWPHPCTTLKQHPTRTSQRTDLGNVRGQPEARYALLIAAVGGHHMLLHGEPGAGKSLLASCLPSILPDLCAEDMMTVAAIRSLAGFQPTLDMQPPCESISPGTSVAALVGGGSRQVRPGAVSLAHCGVLILDEAPELPRRLLESLRTPLDEGQVSTRRAHAIVTFPARFQLVMTANPCPCGLRECRCAPHSRRLYRRRLSGPILDRIDIVQAMTQPSESSLAVDEGLSSTQARAMVVEARRRSVKRWPQWPSNAYAEGELLQVGVPSGCLDAMRREVERGRLSMRGLDRVLRVAWSIADLEMHPEPTVEDLGLAMDLRTKDSWE